MDQVYFCILSWSSSNEDVKSTSGRALALKEARILNSSNRRWERPLGQALERARGWDWEQASKRTREQVGGRVLERIVRGERGLSLDGIKNEGFWKSVLDDPTLYSLSLEVLCDLLNLTPRPQWWEALRMRGLPQVPRRITLADPHVWQLTEEAFASHGAGETDCLHAASQLLLDAWLWFAGAHDHPDKSPFASLVRLTRPVDAPPLRVAHCIRDLAYGDESRANDLVAMVRSKEPAYRRLFEEAFWRDPVDLRKPTRAKQRRTR
jgi:hypothetical protein